MQYRKEKKKTNKPHGRKKKELKRKSEKRATSKMQQIKNTNKQIIEILRMRSNNFLIV